MDFPRPTKLPNPVFFSTAGEFRRRTGKTPLRTSGTWAEVSYAVSCPVWVDRTFTVKRLYAMNGAVVSGNCDIALLRAVLYDSYYTDAYRWVPENLITSAGSTVQAGTNAWQVFDVADKIIPPGLYWLAYVLDNTTGTVMRIEQSTNSNVLGFIANTMRTWNPIPLTGQRGLPVDSSYAIPLLAMGGIA